VLIGFNYQQTTDDRLNGARVNDDVLRGRDFTIGPQVRIRLGPQGALAFKYERDTLLQNKPRGNALMVPNRSATPLGPRKVIPATG
jgi:hypothetical protein